MIPTIRDHSSTLLLAKARTGAMARTGAISKAMDKVKTRAMAKVRANSLTNIKAPTMTKIRSGVTAAFAKKYYL